MSQEPRPRSSPPIDVYRVGDLHFVKDGHHRISVGRATGHKTIEAYVTVVLTRIPATGISCRGGLPLKTAGSGGAIPGGEDTGDRGPADRPDAL